MDDRAIDADGGEWADQRAISIEIDPFYDGFRLRNAADDVPPMRGEQIRAAQRVHTASLPSLSARAMPDVPSAIAATKLTNAHAKIGSSL